MEGLPEVVKASVERQREEQSILYTTGHNPWRISCHKEQLAKMHKSFQDTNKAHSKYYACLFAAPYVTTDLQV